MERKTKIWIVVGVLALVLIAIIPLKVLYSETDQNLRLLAISIILSITLGGVNMLKSLFRSSEVEQKDQQIRTHLMECFASDEMGDGMVRLQEFKRNHIDFDKVYKKMRENKDTEAEQLNRDRRRYSHYIHKIYASPGKVDDEFIRSVVNIGQVEFLLNVIEPLDMVEAQMIGKEYNKEMFDEFRRIYKRELEKR